MDHRVHLSSRGFTQARPRVVWFIRFNLAWVYSVVVGFILVHVDSFVSRLGVVGFIRVSVHSGAIGIVGFTRVCVG